MRSRVREQPRRRMCLVVALAVTPTGCLVSFNDWPDASDARGGSTGAGGMGSDATRGGTAGAINGTWSSGIGGAAAGGAAAGGAATGGAAAGGAATGGAATGGAATGGAAAGNPATAARRGKIQWLTLTGARAAGTDEPNQSFGIEGLFRGYSDPCATLTFDPLTRCASGATCSVDPTYQNWGAAIGFDFRRMLRNSQPSDTKLVWDPSTVNAIGVAWRISGRKLPQLQLWVLNMDSTWNGSCAATTCEIQGPPDGSGNILTAGELYFDDMEKEDWGGAGVPYRYDAADTLALQFKVTTVVVGAVPFQFCIDQLGIIFPQ